MGYRGLVMQYKLVSVIYNATQDVKWLQLARGYERRIRAEEEVMHRRGKTYAQINELFMRYFENVSTSVQRDINEALRAHARIMRDVAR
jgi:hypothetical protein